MHEIKRLIAEKEKCFALNQKTIQSNGTNLASFRVSDQSNFVTELDTDLVSGNICFLFILIIRCNIFGNDLSLYLMINHSFCDFLENTVDKRVILQPIKNEAINPKDEDEESNLSIANSSILSVQVS